MTAAFRRLGWEPCHCMLQLQVDQTVQWASSRVFTALGQLTWGVPACAWLSSVSELYTH